MSYKRIEAALREGARLHAFRSGGGLRVVRVENKQRLVGYGEDGHIYESLRLAEKATNALCGARTSRLLTGSASSTDELDAWILQGHTFDAWADMDDIVVELVNQYYRPSPSDELLAEARSNGSAKWPYKDHVVLILDVCSHRQGPCCYRTESLTKGTASWVQSVTKTGRAKTLKEAIELAIAAPLIEQVQKAA